MYQNNQALPISEPPQLDFFNIEPVKSDRLSAIQVPRTIRERLSVRLQQVANTVVEVVIGLNPFQWRIAGRVYTDSFDNELVVDVTFGPLTLLIEVPEVFWFIEGQCRRI